jgi:hypothetical protein
LNISINGYYIPFDIFYFYGNIIFGKISYNPLENNLKLLILFFLKGIVLYYFTISIFFRKYKEVFKKAMSELFK